MHASAVAMALTTGLFLRILLRMAVSSKTFLTDSCLEHLRAHERVTNADRLREHIVRQFLVDGDPKTMHLIGVYPN